VSTEKSPYRIAVRDLPATCRIDVDPAFVASAVSGLPVRDALEVEDGAPLADGGQVDLELYGEDGGDSVFAQGTVSGQVTVACSRCLGPAVVGFDERIRVTFLPGHAMPAAPDQAPDGGDEVELAADDLDLFPYDGETVDLEPLVREQFVLSVPFAPLCKDDCAGLCPQCGADRNLAPCSCQRPVDPRLAALAGLKLPS